MNGLLFASPSGGGFQIAASGSSSRGRVNRAKMPINPSCSGLQEARTLFEGLLGLRNDVGRLAEEYDPHTARQLGIFPQALSHLALVDKAHNLAKFRGTGAATRGMTVFSLPGFRASGLKGGGDEGEEGEAAGKAAAERRVSDCASCASEIISSTAATASRPATKAAGEIQLLCGSSPLGGFEIIYLNYEFRFQVGDR